MPTTVLIAPAESFEAQCTARALEGTGIVPITRATRRADAVLLFLLPGAPPPRHPYEGRREACPLLLVTRRLDPTAYNYAREVEAAGLVSWTTPTDALVDAIESLVRGGVQHPATVPQDGDPMHTLTERELEIVHLLGEGATNEAIAGMLDISYHTVRTHVAHVLAKLGVSHRYAVAALARRNMPGGPPPSKPEAAVS